MTITYGTLRRLLEDDDLLITIYVHKRGEPHHMTLLDLANNLGMTQEFLQRKSRKRELVIKRVQFIKAASKAGFFTKEIATFMNCDRTNISHHNQNLKYEQPLRSSQGSKQVPDKDWSTL